MTTVHETINLDAREAYEDDGIGHNPLCECEGCNKPFGGYADKEQQMYYAALQSAYDTLFHCDDCGTCTVCHSFTKGKE
jgi:hypothetical protein